MDDRLVAWARAVKVRHRGGPPPLWLFTDRVATPRLDQAIAALPRLLCGVVFRHDGVPGRATLAQSVARHCRRRGVALVVAGDARLAWRLRAGVHLRGGRALPGSRRVPGLVTSSAHGVADLVRARRAGAALAFLSPVFPTPSHPGAAALGPVRWAALARRFPGRCMALGGVQGRTAPRIPFVSRGAAAIRSLLP